MTKKTVLIIMALLLTIQWGAMAHTTDTLTVRIKGMRCEECAHKVKNALKKGPGIQGISFNIERRTATIAYDPAATSVDSIQARLAATGRYKASDYSPSDTIMRGMGLRIDDMHCQKCYNRISQRLQMMEGIDSMAPHLDKSYIFVRYDANKTYNIPAEIASQETIDEVMIIDGVEDANVNAEKKSLAVTYFTDETTAEKLFADIKAAGIEAVMPPAHECKEEQ